MDKRHQSIGQLQYEGRKLSLYVDKGIANYYRSLIPKYMFSQSQAYDPHITVVRGGGIENPPNMELWGKHEGKKLMFEYSPIVQYDGIYYYLSAYSNALEDIREELGLNRHRIGYSDFHITIANSKPQP